MENKSQVLRVMKVLRQHIRAGDYGVVDNILRGASISHMKPEVAIAVLTITLPIKSKLTHRASFYDKVIGLLASEGEKPSSVLRGLQ